MSCAWRRAAAANAAFHLRVGRPCAWRSRLAASNSSRSEREAYSWARQANAKQTTNGIESRRRRCISSSDECKPRSLNFHSNIYLADYQGSAAGTNLNFLGLHWGGEE